MSETTTPWPLVPGSLVTARFAQMYGDSSDEDYNTEWVPLVGQELIFTPSITGPIVYDPAGAKIIAELKPFLGVVNPDGFVVATDGGHPIRLLPTNDPLMSRTGWLWTCSWGGGKVSFPVPSAGEVNIADFIVAPPGNPAIEEWVDRIANAVGAVGSLGGWSSVESRLMALETGGGGTGSGVQSVSGTVDLGTTPGLYEVYALGAATVQGVILAAGDAAVFRLLGGGWSYMVVGVHTSWQTGSSVVVASAPTFTDADGTANDRYTIPANTGVEYRKGGTTIAAGTYTPTAGESVTITAVALDGYTLTGTTSWSKTFSTSTAPISVTASAPTWTDNTSAGGGSWTTPTVTGVTYSPASGTATQGQSVTVTATAKTGYTLSGTDSWTHTFPVAAVVQVTATAPTRDDTANTYTIPTVTGVEYLVDGAVKASGTYPVGNVNQTVSVTARALSGYALSGTASWSLAFTVALTPEEAALALSPLVYLPLDDAAAGTLRNLGSSTVTFKTSTTTPQPVFGAPTIGGRGTSVDFTSAEAASWVGSKVGPLDRGHLWGTGELTEFSVSLRVNVSSVTTDQRLLYVAGQNNDGHNHQMMDARLIGGTIYMSSGANFASTALTVGTHTITATTKIGGLTRLYIDGQLKDTKESLVTLYYPSVALVAGNNHNTRILGRISDFIFTTSEITAGQVATLHASYGASA